MITEDIQYKKIIDHIYDGVYLVDNNRIIKYWNKSAERISGFSKEEVIDSSCADNILCHVDYNGNNLCKHMCPLAKSLIDGQSRTAELYLHHKKGHRVPVSIRISPIINKRGEISGAVEIFNDMTSSMVNELRLKELEQIALMDPLTKLGNRYYIERELKLKLEEFNRYNTLFGVMFMDIDKFKDINDRYGHLVGDKVLKLVADTLIANSRPFDIYGRWGGDEFIGVIRNINEETLTELTKRIIVAIRTSFILYNNEKIHLSISIGETLFRKNDTMESLLARVDSTLYKCKDLGRDCSLLQ